MKINILNHIAEERELAEFAVFLEGIFDGGTDLEDFEDDNVSEGIRVLEALAADKGDDLSQEQVELAKKSWLYLRKLITLSSRGLKEQVKINSMITAGTRKENDIDLSVG